MQNSDYLFCEESLQIFLEAPPVEDFGSQTVENFVPDNGKNSENILSNLYDIM